MTIQELENWLWDAACVIRGPVDAPKFKDYLLPLIFLKRLSMGSTTKSPACLPIRQRGDGLLSEQERRRGQVTLSKRNYYKKER